MEKKAEESAGMVKFEGWSAATPNSSSSRNSAVVTVTDSFSNNSESLTNDDSRSRFNGVQNVSGYSDTAVPRSTIDGAPKSFLMNRYGLANGSNNTSCSQPAQSSFLSGRDSTTTAHRSGSSLGQNEQVQQESGSQTLVNSKNSGSKYEFVSKYDEYKSRNNNNNSNSSVDISNSSIALNGSIQQQQQQLKSIERFPLRQQPQPQQQPLSLSQAPPCRMTFPASDRHSSNNSFTDFRNELQSLGIVAGSSSSSSSSISQQLPPRNAVNEHTTSRLPFPRTQFDKRQARETQQPQLSSQLQQLENHHMPAHSVRASAGVGAGAITGNRKFDRSPVSHSPLHQEAFRPLMQLPIFNKPETTEHTGNVQRSASSSQRTNKELPSFCGSSSEMTAGAFRQSKPPTNLGQSAYEHKQEGANSLKPQAPPPQRKGNLNIPMDILSYDSDYFPQYTMFLLSEEEKNISKFRERVEKEKEKISRDFEQVKSEVNNLLDDLKMEMTCGVDAHFKQFMDNYASFKSEVIEFKSIKAELPTQQQAPPTSMDLGTSSNVQLIKELEELRHRNHLSKLYHYVAEIQKANANKILHSSQLLLTQMSSSSPLYNVDATQLNLRELKNAFALNLSQRFDPMSQYVRQTGHFQQQQQQQQQGLHYPLQEQQQEQQFIDRLPISSNHHIHNENMNISQISSIPCNRAEQIDRSGFDRIAMHPRSNSQSSFHQERSDLINPSPNFAQMTDFADLEDEEEEVEAATTTPSQYSVPFPLQKQDNLIDHHRMMPYLQSSYQKQQQHYASHELIEQIREEEHQYEMGAFAEHENFD